MIHIKYAKPVKKTASHSHDSHGAKSHHHGSHDAKKPHHTSGHAPMRKSTVNVSRGK